MTPIIEVVMVITQEVTKGMGDRITIEGEILEVKIMIEIGMGHMKGRTETEEPVRA